jgi:hypothetical protein
VDVAELCIALESEAAALAWYLDLQTGDLLLLGPEYEPAEHRGVTAAEVEGDPARFSRVPPGTRLEVMGDMQAFSVHLTDLVLRESLQLALHGLRPERRFRSALSWLPDTLREWRRYRRERMEARALAWLGSLGYAPRS